MNKGLKKLEDLGVNCEGHPNIVAIKRQHQNLVWILVSKSLVKTKSFLLVKVLIRGKRHKRMIFICRLE